MKDLFLIKRFDNEVSVSSLVLSDEGSFAVTGDTNDRVRLWDIDNGNVIKSFVGHTGRITSIALSMYSNNKPLARNN